jgi:hypothetical protein
MMSAQKMDMNGYGAGPSVRGLKPVSSLSLVHYRNDGCLAPARYGH